MASSLLTFIDIGVRIVRNTYDVYHSATGATEENAHVSTVIADLEKAAGELASCEPSTVNDIELVSLSKKCRELSESLLQLLRRLQRKDIGPLHSFKAAWAVARKQKDVASLERRLAQYREQIVLRLLLMLW